MRPGPFGSSNAALQVTTDAKTWTKLVPPATAQAVAIDRLEAELRRLRQRLGEVESGWAPSPADDKPPPHY